MFRRRNGSHLRTFIGMLRVKRKGETPFPRIISRWWGLKLFSQCEGKSPRFGHDCCRNFLLSWTFRNFFKAFFRCKGSLVWENIQHFPQPFSLKLSFTFQLFLSYNLPCSPPLWGRRAQYFSWRSNYNITNPRASISFFGTIIR